MHIVKDAIDTSKEQKLKLQSSNEVITESVQTETNISLLKELLAILGHSSYEINDILLAIQKSKTKKEKTHHEIK